MNPIRLFCTRREVEQVNGAELLKVPGKAVRYSALDRFHLAKGHEKYLSCKNEKVRGDRDHLLAQTEHRYETILSLKKDMPVILLTNIDVERGLVNGAQGKIVGFKEYDEADMPRLVNFDSSQYSVDDRNERLVSTGVPTTGGSHFLLRHDQVQEFIDCADRQCWPVVEFENGETTPIHAICDVQELGEDEPYSLLLRTQIPLQAAWAITIHKAQGMTLTSVEVDVSRTFEEGQVYVALSRASTLGGLKVKGMRTGFACDSGNAEVHEWLWGSFR